MVPETFNFTALIDSIENRQFSEIVYLLEQEATAAERSLYQRKIPLNDIGNPSVQYVRTLKKFLEFVRFSIKPVKSEKERYLKFQKALKSLRRQNPMANRRLPQDNDEFPSHAHAI
ncbi:MAG: hypothetical protein WAV08_16105 [Desulfobacterales bacterium]|jgi:hypothetical protein|nr:hypothetical protein [Desulfobacterales bacterium]